MIDSIFHFMLAIVFLSFNFHMYGEGLWRKSLVWFLKRSLNEVSPIVKYSFSGLLGADTTALYTMFAVKHLFSSGHLALFLLLHSCLLEVGWIILRLWEELLANICFHNFWKLRIKPYCFALAFLIFLCWFLFSLS